MYLLAYLAGSVHRFALVLRIALDGVNRRSGVPCISGVSAETGPAAAVCQRLVGGK